MMPRKKPDTTPWFDDTKRVDSVFAKMVYHNQWGENYIMRMKDNPETQRMVKCQQCGLIIPRDVPRLCREGSWYKKGHLCMTCGKKELKDFISNLKALELNIEEYVALGEALQSCANQVEEDKRYEDKVCMGKMIQVMRKSGTS